MPVPMNKEEYGYVKFLGDYSKLKGLGFTFQKLFAGNYMQWERNHFRVWKRGGDITHDSYNLFKLIKFLSTNPNVKSRKNHVTGELESIAFLKFYDDPDTDEFTYYSMDEENFSRHRDYMQAVSLHCKDKSNPMPEYLGDWEWVGVEVLNEIQRMRDEGWYELGYYPQD